MTKELLEQYPDICEEIEDLERAAGTAGGLSHGKFERKIERRNRE